MPATITPIQPYLEARDLQERIEWAEQEAGVYFNMATKGQKAAYDAALDAARGCVGPVWERRRQIAKAKWRHSTKEARDLFDRTVEWFLSHDELSDELDALWTDLANRNIVAAALAEAAE